MNNTTAVVTEGAAEGAWHVPGVEVTLKHVPVQRAADWVGANWPAFSTSTGGRSETTITSFWNTLAHTASIAGLEYSAAELTDIRELRGASPYGAATSAAGNGTRQPSENRAGTGELMGSTWLNWPCASHEYMRQVAHASSISAVRESDRTERTPQTRLGK